MKPLNLISQALLISSAVFSQTSLAAQIFGQVTNEQGQPVSGAVITLDENKKQTTTDDQGRYTISVNDVKHLHLHVYSSDYIHADLELTVANEKQEQNFVLTPSIIENIVVTANALESSVLESTTPVSVLSGEQLRRNLAPTLGETLKTTPGVHSNYFGPVASSPIIRGTDGPRVKIVQNGLDASDASRVGPDHNVATDANTAQQIEVLRGPATLQYGSGAIGGVVNVVDNRIPTEIYDSATGEAELRYDSVSDERFAKIDANASAGQFSFHFDGFTRETNDYDIPGFAETTPDEGEAPGTLESTAIDTDSATAGISYVGDSGYIGFSVQRLDNLYGIPGHGHGEEEEEGEHEEGEEEEEESVSLDVDMTRYQVAGEWLAPTDYLTKVKFTTGYTDYEHQELEGEELGTRFTNETWETRLTAEHIAVNGWHGIVGLHQSTVDYAAIGEEAFTPPSETDSLALFVIEEKKFGNVTVELGARIEHTDIDPEDTLTVTFHEDEEQTFNLSEQSFTSVSLSAGANWQYQPGRAFAVSLSRSERAPSHQELFSAGAHLATQTFDVGSVFSLDADNELILNPQAPEEEVSTNLDITLRKFDGDFGYTVSFFYNQVDDYLVQNNTGLFAAGEDEHGHGEEEEEDGHEEEGGHEEEEGLPVFLFQQQDVEFYGFESEVHARLNDNLQLQVYADYIRGKLDQGGDLPRIPPLRLGTKLSFDWQQWYGDVEYSWYAKQDNISSFETETGSYGLLSASINYVHQLNNADLVLFLRGSNLTDEEARVHTSFLKDQAPLPGRSLTIGMRVEF
ncbi:TonB-dependent receptor [Endozoicomonas sp. G2_1]|uniref:TonB-dependent receptor n=1 Tax=Endozoicomonas sp. G2_1 TaxID=2821091 RepID=UPI001AD96AD9|nr:TonB-dependent receptor [Endozoicomonas sp. G2_1]MBO9491321.1 TonB-dependent receptor [Endozoicomonas sp. G2_1]